MLSFYVLCFAESTKRNCVLKKDKDNFNKSGVNLFQKDNVLSVSGEEDKHDGIPSTEKIIKLDHQQNFCENLGKKIKDPEEKRLKIVTSVAVDNLKHSSPKIIFQQTQEPIFEDAQSSTFAITNVIKFNCIGSSIENHNHSGDNPNRKQDTINYNFSFGNAHSQDATFVIPARWENPTCCQDYFCNTNITLASLSPPTSYFSPQGTTMSNHTDFSSDQSWDIPPPNEFADMIQDNSLEELTEDLASFNIDRPTDSSSCEQQSNFHCTHEMEMYDQISGCLEYLDEGEDTHMASHFFDQLSESDNFEPSFMRLSLPISRSSFTMDFINKHEQIACFRNNSVSTFQHTRPIKRKRRQTYPGTSESALCTMQEDLLPFREFFSSGTISSLTMQSLPLQAEKLATFCQGDGSLSLFGTDVKQNSIYDGCFEAILGNANYQTDGQHNFNQFCTETLEKTAEVAFGNIESQQQAKNPSQTSDVGECLYNPRPLKVRDPGEPAEQSGVAESHFEEELLELGCPSAGLVTGKHTQTALIIQVIPPSPCGSDDTRKEGSPKCVRNRLSSSKVKRKQASQDSAISALPNSALTVTFGSDRRTLHIKDNLDLTSKVTDVSLVSERGDLGSPEMKEIKKEVQRMSLAVGHSFSRPALSHCTDETIQSCSDREQVGIEDPECSVNTTLSHANDSRMDQETEGRRKQVCKTEKLEKHNVVKASLEPKELLKPTIHQDSDSSGSDHWAVRRKLFKENRQWSSAGGGSITSDITEDSVSDDTHSMDMTVRDIEERGFYTATFHYTAWTYRGDDSTSGLTSGTSDTSLGTKPRPVSIRERTVKISKGMGEYPWGFRIQFSKPIVVTEVDTNGAAEEAGLIVGDYLLAVNGTDVTSIPHSEAAELARQGPDILTLTIGSDIARSPNTPRPACRGYLHKRTQSGFIKGWRKRWFVLTHDCCLHYFGHKRDEGRRVALSTLKLEGAEVGADVSLGKPFVIRCCPQTADRVYFLCATSNQEMKRWLEAMVNATQPVTQNHVWVDVTRHNSNLPPLAVKNPECLGLLYEIDKNKDMSRQLYCILKDGCLYFYNNIRSTHALGGLYLHGYMVREQLMGSKKSTIELKPPSDEFKTHYLSAENPNENKRWIEAMKVSINKWQPLHWAMQSYTNQAPEETKM
ncbi:Pleckstrin y domain-containing family A member 5 [Merluccius polli]|uniref:Pleckstrin y domain-containing family A member 5 n=1 Tax=Merluccius polli TaxID=89951 RepID=A0AA47NUI9_MERPO|nr:Pleckstrin y domain-containing family A member 5 [Merluccius polli]